MVAQIDRAHRMLIGRKAIKAAQTPGGIGLGIAGFGPAMDHQAIIRADLIIVMQGHHNLAVRQNPADQHRQFDAPQNQMMNMHHVWRPVFQKAGEIRGHCIKIGLGHVEPVEMPGPEQHFITGIIDGLKACPRAAFAMDIIGRPDEKRIAFRPLVGMKQIMGEDFGPTRMQIGVIMGKHHYPGVHAVLRGFWAIRKSW